MRACIFDLDGTLTNTLESLTYSVNETLKEMGLGSITADQCRSFVGDGATCLVERALRVSGDEAAVKLDEAMMAYGRIFQKNCTYHVTPYEGIYEMLRLLKEQGIKLAVLSNKPHEQTVDVVHSIFGEETFDHVQGQCEEIAKKPDPAGVRCLLEELQVPKEECLYVGDSEVDVATGNAAEVKCVGVSWGFRSAEALAEAGAKYIVDAPGELLKFIRID